MDINLQQRNSDILTGLYSPTDLAALNIDTYERLNYNIVNEHNLNTDKFPMFKGADFSSNPSSNYSPSTSISPFIVDKSQSIGDITNPKNGKKIKWEDALNSEDPVITEIVNEAIRQDARRRNPWVETGAGVPEILPYQKESEKFMKTHWWNPVDNTRYGYNPRKSAAENEQLYKENVWDNYSFMGKVWRGATNFVGRTAVNGVLKFAETASTLGSMLLNLVNVRDNYWMHVADNALVRSLENAEQSVKDNWFSMFKGINYDNKGIWSKLADPYFWNDTMADAAAFMASAIIPGMAIGKLAVLGRLGKLGAFGTAIGTDLAEASSFGGKGLQTIFGSRNIAGIGAHILNTTGESAIETVDSFKTTKQNILDRIERGELPKMSEDEINKKAGEAASSTFIRNLAVLTFSNAMENKWFQQLAGNKGVLKSERELGVSLNKELDAVEKKSFFNRITGDTKLNKLLYETTGGDRLRFWGKRALSGTLMEGYYEENFQTSIQRNAQGEYVRKESETGKEVKEKSTGNLFTQAFKQASDAAYGKDTEVAESIAAGAILGIAGNVGISKIAGYTKEDGSTAWFKGERRLERDRIESFINKIKDAKDTFISSTKGIYNDDGSINEQLIAEKGNKIAEITKKMELADTKPLKEEAEALRIEAFSDFVDAHIKIGTIDQFINKIENWSPEDKDVLSAYGFSNKQENSPQEYAAIAKSLNDKYNSTQELKFSSPKEMDSNRAELIANYAKDLLYSNRKSRIIADKLLTDVTEHLNSSHKEAFSLQKDIDASLNNISESMKDSDVEVDDKKISFQEALSTGKLGTIGDLKKAIVNFKGDSEGVQKSILDQQVRTLSEKTLQHHNLLKDYPNIDEYNRLSALMDQSKSKIELDDALYKKYSSVNSLSDFAELYDDYINRVEEKITKQNPDTENPPIEDTNPIDEEEKSYSSENEEVSDYIKENGSISVKKRGEISAKWKKINQEESIKKKEEDDKERIKKSEELKNWLDDYNLDNKSEKEKKKEEGKKDTKESDSKEENKPTENKPIKEKVEKAPKKIIQKEDKPEFIGQGTDDDIEADAINDSQGSMAHDSPLKTTEQDVELNDNNQKVLIPVKINGSSKNLQKQTSEKYLIKLQHNIDSIFKEFRSNNSLELRLVKDNESFLKIHSSEEKQNRFKELLKTGEAKWGTVIVVFNKDINAPHVFSQLDNNPAIFFNDIENFYSNNGEERDALRLLGEQEVSIDDIQDTDLLLKRAMIHNNANELNEDVELTLLRYKTEIASLLNTRRAILNNEIDHAPLTHFKVSNGFNNLYVVKEGDKSRIRTYPLLSFLNDNNKINNYSIQVNNNGLLYIKYNGAIFRGVSARIDSVKLDSGRTIEDLLISRMKESRVLNGDEFSEFRKEIREIVFLPKGISIAKDANIGAYFVSESGEKVSIQSLNLRLNPLIDEDGNIINTLNLSNLGEEKAISIPLKKLLTDTVETYILPFVKQNGEFDFSPLQKYLIYSINNIDEELEKPTKVIEVAKESTLTDEIIKSSSSKRGVQSFSKSKHITDKQVSANKKDTKDNCTE